MIWIVQRVVDLDYSDLGRYGETKEIFSQGFRLRGYDYDVLYGWKVLDEYNSKTDYIVCTGDPVLSAIALNIATALSAGGFIRLLRWDKKSRRYNEVMFNLLT